MCYIAGSNKLESHFEIKKKFSLLQLLLLGIKSFLRLRQLTVKRFNPLNAELNPVCHLLALLGVHHFLHVSRIRVKSLTLGLLMSYIYIYIYIYDISSLRVKVHGGTILQTIFFF